MLDEVKESIINAYEIKTGLSRAKLSHLMDAETWMDANSAIEYGFADEVMQRAITDEVEIPTVSMVFFPCGCDQLPYGEAGSQVQNRTENRRTHRKNHSRFPYGTAQSYQKLEVMDYDYFGNA